MKFPALALVVCICFAIVACDKDKFETKPRLEFHEYSRLVLPPNGLLRFRINYFDKEGDLNSAPFIAIKENLNRFPPVPDILVDTFRMNLPDFPAKDKAEITFELDYSRLKEGGSLKNDTIRFRFAVTDLAGNKSDTLTSEDIILQKP